MIITILVGALISICPQQPITNNIHSDGSPTAIDFSSRCFSPCFLHADIDKPSSNSPKTRGTSTNTQQNKTPHPVVCRRPQSGSGRLGEGAVSLLLPPLVKRRRGGGSTPQSLCGQSNLRRPRPPSPVSGPPGSPSQAPQTTTFSSVQSPPALAKGQPSVGLVSRSYRRQQKAQSKSFNWT